MNINIERYQMKWIQNEKRSENDKRKNRRKDVNKFIEQKSQGINKIGLSQKGGRRHHEIAWTFFLSYQNAIWSNLGNSFFLDSSSKVTPKWKLIEFLPPEANQGRREKSCWWKYEHKHWKIPNEMNAKWRMKWKR